MWDGHGSICSTHLQSDMFNWEMPFLLSRKTLLGHVCYQCIVLLSVTVILCTHNCVPCVGYCLTAAGTNDWLCSGLTWGQQEHMRLKCKQAYYRLCFVWQICNSYQLPVRRYLIPDYWYLQGWWSAERWAARQRAAPWPNHYDQRQEIIYSQMAADGGMDDYNSLMRLNLAEYTGMEEIT